MSNTTAYVQTINYSTKSGGSFLSLVEWVVSTFQQKAVNLGTLDDFAKRCVLGLLSKIVKGQLHVEFKDEKWDFGQPYNLDRIDGPPKPLSATVKIIKDGVWTWLFLHADFGFADAYLLNEVEVDSLNSLFRIFILNRKILNELSTSVSPLVRVLSYIANSRLANKITGSRSNISAHYYLPTEVFNAFLTCIVGIEFMTGWFRSMSWAMKLEGSFKVFTMSTVPDTRWHQYATEVDFVRKYIYPGGQLSSVATLVSCIRDAGLNVNSVEDIGPHYARTLREWSYRFQRNFSTLIAPAMIDHFPSLNPDQLEIFRRKFIYYFAYSEAGFATRSISDHVFTLTREANLNL